MVYLREIIAKCKERILQYNTIEQIAYLYIVSPEDIDKCDFILSSSLHGIIVADSFNIPNAWIYLTDKVIGKGFKFHDYFSAIGINHKPLNLDGSESLSQLLKYCHKPPEAIEEV